MCRILPQNDKCPAKVRPKGGPKGGRQSTGPPDVPTLRRVFTGGAFQSHISGRLQACPVAVDEFATAASILRQFHRKRKFKKVATGYCSSARIRTPACRWVRTVFPLYSPPGFFDAVVRRLLETLSTRSQCFRAPAAVGLFETAPFGGRPYCTSTAVNSEAIGARINRAVLRVVAGQQGTVRNALADRLPQGPAQRREKR
jgi:hypothetical protein